MLVCSLDCDRDPVFLAGEKIQVRLTIQNQSSDDGEEESLAICTGQLTCRCAVNGNRVNKEAAESNMSSFFNSTTTNTFSKTTSGVSSYKKNTNHYQLGASNTSFNIAQDEKGYNVFCTKPEIISCDLSLSKNESISYAFCVQLPTSSEMVPPSFNGHCVRFTYKLLFGFQKVGQPMQMIKCPVRVLTLCHKLHGEYLSAISMNSSRDPMTGGNSPSSRKYSPLDLSEKEKENPFHEESEIHLKSTEEYDQQVAMETEIAMQSLSLSHRGVGGPNKGGNAVAYSVRNGQTEIAKFSLAKSAFRIGEEISGFFEFNPFPRYCLQYTVNLQCEERLSDQFRLDASSNINQPECFGSKCEYVADISHCELSLPIPHSVTPSFTTELVSLVWSLQFTFIISTDSHPDIATQFTNTSFDDENDDQIVNYSCPTSYETFSWTLPITLLPNNPFKLQSCSVGLKRNHTLNMT